MTHASISSSSAASTHFRHSSLKFSCSSTKKMMADRRSQPWDVASAQVPEEAYASLIQSAAIEGRHPQTHSNSHDAREWTFWLRRSKSSGGSARSQSRPTVGHRRARDQAWERGGAARRPGSCERNAPLVGRVDQDQPTETRWPSFQVLSLLSARSLRPGRRIITVADPGGEHAH